jgi:hypothetical protein
MPLWLQYAIVGAIVVAALWIFAKKQLPGTLRKARLALAGPLVREGRPAWMRALARWIAPPSSGAGASACGGCDNCGPESKRQ